MSTVVEVGSEVQAEQKADVEVAKKPRGRPKKIIDPNADPAVKKPRGRPKKVLEKIVEDAVDQQVSQHINSQVEQQTGQGEGFNIDEIFKERPMLSLLIGRSKSGKTYFIKFLINYLTCKLKLFKFGIVFTGTGFTKDYDYIDKKYVLPAFSDSTHLKYIQKLQKMKKELGDNMPANFIVYDDLLGVLDKSKSMDNWFSTFRHTNTYLFLSSQYLNSSASSPLVRIQTNLLFAFDDRTKRTRTSLYEWFGGFFDSQAEFNEAYSKATKEDHSTLVFVQGRKTRNDSYFMLKAPEFIPEIKLKFSSGKGEGDADGADNTDENDRNSGAESNRTDVNQHIKPGKLDEHIKQSNEISRSRHHETAAQSNAEAKKLKQTALSHSELSYLLTAGKKYGL